LAGIQTSCVTEPVARTNLPRISVALGAFYLLTCGKGIFSRGSIDELQIDVDKDSFWKLVRDRAFLCSSLFEEFMIVPELCRDPAGVRCCSSSELYRQTK
jgi:hypothetical protein